MVRPAVVCVCGRLVEGGGGAGAEVRGAVGGGVEASEGLAGAGGCACRPSGQRLVAALQQESSAQSLERQMGWVMDGVWKWMMWTKTLANFVF